MRSLAQEEVEDFYIKHHSLYFKPTSVCLLVVSKVYIANHMTESAESEANHQDMMRN